MIPNRPRTPEPNFDRIGMEPVSLRPGPIAEVAPARPDLDAVEEVPEEIMVSPEEEDALLDEPEGEVLSETPLGSPPVPPTSDGDEVALLAGSETETRPANRPEPNLVPPPQDDEEAARRREEEDQLMGEIRQQVAGYRVPTPPPRRGGMRYGAKPRKRLHPRRRRRNRSGRTTAPLEASSDEEPPECPIPPVLEAATNENSPWWGGREDLAWVTGYHDPVEMEAAREPTGTLLISPGSLVDRPPVDLGARARISATQGTSQRTRPGAPTPTVARPITEGCWNCEDTSHRYSSCGLPRKRFCYGCGAENRTARNCPRCGPLWQQGTLGPHHSQTGGDEIPPQPQASMPAERQTPPPPNPPLVTPDHPLVLAVINLIQTLTGQNP